MMTLTDTPAYAPRDELLEGLIRKEKTPAVDYVLFDKDRILHRYQTGLADIAKELRISDRTTYNAFSVTKTFTALAVFQLAEKSLLDVDASMKTYLPEFPYGDSITIHHVLTHTAGIPNPNPLSWIHLIDEPSTFDRNAFFKEVFNKHPKLKSAPGEKFAYSNLGYVLLGQLIEHVNGQTYEEYIVKRIIEPLGLRPEELGFEIQEASLQAKGYQKRLSGLNLLLGFFIDKTKFMGEPEEKWRPFESYYVNGTAYGGLIGTTDAFVRYVQTLLKDDSALLSVESKSRMFGESISSKGKATGMCSSWFTSELNGRRCYYHPGGGGGYYCEVRIYPEEGLGSVIFFNRTGVSDEHILDQLDRFHFT